MVESLAPMWDEQRARGGGATPPGPPPSPPRTPAPLCELITEHVRTQLQVRTRLTQLFVYAVKGSPVLTAPAPSCSCATCCQTAASLVCAALQLQGCSAADVGDLTRRRLACAACRPAGPFPHVPLTAAQRAGSRRAAGRSQAPSDFRSCLRDAHLARAGHTYRSSRQLGRLCSLPRPSAGAPAALALSCKQPHYL